MTTSIRVSGLTTVLVTGVLLAGSPAGSAAQTGSPPHGMSLREAIEEARQSPFHAAAGLGIPGEARPGAGDIDAMSGSHLLQSASQDTVVAPPVIVFTFFAAAASHVAGIYLLYECIEDDSYKSSIVGCILGPVIPWPLVAAPAATAGVGAGKAFKASAFGLLGGATAFSLIKLAKDDLSPYGAGILSTLVHALTVRALIR